MRSRFETSGQDQAEGFPLPERALAQAISLTRIGVEKT
jgi:hypothetical protein